MLFHIFSSADHNKYNKPEIGEIINHQKTSTLTFKPLRILQPGLAQMFHRPK